MCAIPVPFDPKPIFGKVRAPVRVTLKVTIELASAGSTRP